MEQETDNSCPLTFILSPKWGRGEGEGDVQKQHWVHLFLRRSIDCRSELFSICNLQSAIRNVGESFESPDPFDLLLIPCPCPVEGCLQGFDRLVIDVSIDGIGMTVFSAVGKTESGRISETWPDTVDQFGDQA